VLVLYRDDPLSHSMTAMVLNRSAGPEQSVGAE
jgi:hypothetical protein